MIDKPKTDRLVSAASSEFLWDTEEHTEVHKYITAPILAKLEQANVKNILDLGCGNGSFTSLLADKGYEATGVDHSLSGISIARKSNATLEFNQHDLTEPLPAVYKSQFDCVLSVEVIEHLLLPRSLLSNALYALKPGGLLILTTPYHGYWKNLALAITNHFDDHWHPLRDYGHIKFFSKNTLMHLTDEFGLENPEISTVGRIPLFARSMVFTGSKPA